ncbi:MAG: peptidoglycan-binding protein, partial [Hyphomicrobiaceae bacterium]|nr:peptidoglycan-binding protein [Hyphomicrobiaceae bacterium]
MRGSIRRWLSALLGLLALTISGITSAQSPNSPGLRPGEAFVTRYSGTAGIPSAIDLDGVVGSIIDVRSPGQPALGQHWLNEPQRAEIRARDVGQVFGVALDEASPPNIYVTATAAFGLHRTADNRGWMPGMWGPQGGPGTIYKLSAVNGYRPTVLANVTLDGRANSGAALGNIAFDKWHNQLLVSDLETGMIHRISVTDGRDLGRYDHGEQGRPRFYDTEKGAMSALPAVSFDRNSRARITDCSRESFSRTPECWNIADFRRRIWGLGVRKDEATGETRVYYAVWGSNGFGNPSFPQASDEEKRNSVWSVALTATGDFDPSRITRELSMPDFFVDPAEVAQQGRSNPVSDVAFPQCGDSRTMLLAERGGMRNLGLSAPAAFAHPHQSRVLRYSAGDDDSWALAGRYDVGFYDRRGQKEPRIRAGSAGGAAFGYAYTRQAKIDTAAPNKLIWMTGDALCSPQGPCFNPAANKRTDGSHVHGLQGTPETLLEGLLPEVTPVATLADPYPPSGPRQSYMIDADVNIDEAGRPIMASLTRDDATRIGDIAIYQPCGAEAPEAVPQPPPVVPTAPPVIIEGGAPPVVPDQPDLEKRKTGPAQCVAGDVCSFTITVTNVGTGTWSGPLQELDTMPPGSTLATFGPQPDWACAQSGDTVNCAHTPVTLAPGEVVTLNIDLIIPIGTIGNVENCIQDVWAPLGDDGSAEVVLAIEQRLSALGYDPGAIDGVYDAQTQAAIAAFQADNGLDADGAVSDTLRDTLFPDDAGLSGDANPLNDRSCHTVEVLPPPVLPPPPPPPPIDTTTPPPTEGTRTAQCDDTVRQGGDTPETIEIDLGGRDGPGTFTWEMVSVKDQMQVSLDGTMVLDTGCVSGNGTRAISVPPGTQKATVRVIPNCDGTTGTIWDFKLICPKPAAASPITLLADPEPPEIFTPVPTFVPLPPPCPPGTWRVGHHCEPIISVVAPRCPPPLVRRHGYCVCPNGSLPHHGRCAEVTPAGCPPPLVQRHGRCVCPDGTRLQHGQCVPVTVCRPPLVGIGNRCVCPNGQPPHHGRCDVQATCKPPLVASQGRCVCPNGALPQNGRCTTPTTCRPPMVLQGGHCACPSGTTLQNGRCVSQTCRPPMVLRHGHCVMPEGQKCPPGQTLRNGRCIAGPVACPPGQTLRNGRCIASPTTCPPGFTMRHGQCVRTPTTCPPGTKHDGTRCVPVATPTPPACPPGTRRDGARCVPVATPTPPACPPGTRRDGARCVPVAPPTPPPCPPGTRLDVTRWYPYATPTPPACPPGTRRDGA